MKITRNGIFISFTVPRGPWIRILVMRNRTLGSAEFSIVVAR